MSSAGRIGSRKGRGGGGGALPALALVDVLFGSFSSVLAASVVVVLFMRMNVENFADPPSPPMLQLVLTSSKPDCRPTTVDPEIRVLRDGAEAVYSKMSQFQAFMTMDSLTGFAAVLASDVLSAGETADSLQTCQMNNEKSDRYCIATTLVLLSAKAGHYVFKPGAFYQEASNGGGCTESDITASFCIVQQQSTPFDLCGNRRPLSQIDQLTPIEIDVLR